MTGAAGGVHSIHFSVAAARARRATRNDLDNAPAAGQASAAVGQLTLYGRVIRDHRTIGRKLSEMPQQEWALHGNLQVVLSALLRMEAAVRELIDGEEGGHL